MKWFKIDFLVAALIPDGSSLSPLSSDGINLINEDNGGSVFFCHSEKLPHQLGPVTKVLLDEFWPDNTQECGRRLVGNSFG